MAVDITQKNEAPGESDRQRERGILLRNAACTCCVALVVWGIGRMLFSQWIASHLVSHLCRILVTIGGTPVATWSALVHSGATANYLTYAFAFLAGATVVCKRMCRPRRRIDELKGPARWAANDDNCEPVLLYSRPGSGMGLAIPMLTILRWDRKVPTLHDRAQEAHGACSLTELEGQDHGRRHNTN